MYTIHGDRQSIRAIRDEAELFAANVECAVLRALPGGGGGDERLQKQRRNEIDEQHIRELRLTAAAGAIVANGKRRHEQLLSTGQQ